MSDNNFFRRILRIMKREILIFSRRPLFLFTMILAPVACLIMFMTLMDDGLPTKLPAGIVDMDNTKVSRIAGRVLGSMQETEIVEHYTDFSAARKAMARGEIYGFFYIPKGLTEEAIANRQPRIAFYTNDAYYVPASLLMKDMKYASELTGLALTRENLYAHGLTEREAMGVIQPIVVETHPLNNPYLNYSAYLNNIIVPGVLMLLVMICTTYTIGIEWKCGTQRCLYALSGNSSTTALVGKLLPQTFIFSLMMIFYDVCFYRFWLFPCNCPLWHTMLLGIVAVLAAQAFGVFLFGAFAGQMRLTMCLSSLWGILSFSISGFTYPITAMDTPLQVLAWFFPLRHYYIIYVTHVLDGYSVAYAWKSVAAMLMFLLLPLTVLWRYRAAFLKVKYRP